MNNAPGKEEVENFWREIYGEKVQHNGEVGRINTSTNKTQARNGDQYLKKDVAEALRTSLNWKAPRRDQIPNFWLKQLTATHNYSAAIFNKLIEEDQIPEWLTAGVTFLIQKNEDTENKKNYRPLTCLHTMYKLITFIISIRKI